MQLIQTGWNSTFPTWVSLLWSFLLFGPPLDGGRLSYLSVCLFVFSSLDLSFSGLNKDALQFMMHDPSYFLRDPQYFLSFFMFILISHILPLPSLRYSNHSNGLIHTSWLYMCLPKCALLFYMHFLLNYVNEMMSNISPSTFSLFKKINIVLLRLPMLLCGHLIYFLLWLHSFFYLRPWKDVSVQDADPLRSFCGWHQSQAMMRWSQRNSSAVCAELYLWQRHGHLEVCLSVPADTLIFLARRW